MKKKKTGGNFKRKGGFRSLSFSEAASTKTEKNCDTDVDSASDPAIVGVLLVEVIKIINSILPWFTLHTFSFFWKILEKTN